MSAVTATSFGRYYQPWDLKPFPECVFFQEGPGLRKWQWTDSGMKVINVTNILPDGSVDVNNTNRYIAMHEFESRYSHFAVQKGDIVVASSGNTYGKVGRVRANHLPLMMNTSVVRFRSLSEDLLDADYLYAFLRSHLFSNQIEAFVIGSAQPNFGPSHIREMQILVPPLPTQRKIAAIISAYDDLIENNTRRIKILEEMTQAIYREWFVSFRFPGHEQVRMVDSELGQIPEGWEIKKATDAVWINPSTRVQKEGLKPFLPMGSLSSGTMLIGDIEYREGNGGSKFKNGDTLFARITPCLENGKTAFVQFLPSEDAVAFGSTEFIILRSRTLCPEFVYLMARSDPFRDNAIKSMSGATGRQRVQEACFEKFVFAHPDEGTIANFQEHVSPIFRIVHLLSLKNDNLRRTRDLLLPKLISGELNVENTDINVGGN